MIEAIFLYMNPMKMFVGAIAAVGIVRFGLTVSGFPDGITRYASMTAIILTGTFFFAIRNPMRKDRLKAAYLLIAPYMIIEILALGFTWASGRRTIFHAPEYNLGTSLPVHLAGHFIGGLTWEPLMLFLLMELVHRGHRMMRLRAE